MSVLYVTEYADAGLSLPPVATQPPLAEQKITFTGTAGVSAVFNAKTSLVRIHVDGIASLLFSSGGALTLATVASARMVAGQTEYFIVPRGQGYGVSAITTT